MCYTVKHRDLAFQGRFIIFSPLRGLSTLLENKCFQDATKNDLVNVISQIERNYTSFETKRTEKECMKCFYRWLKGGEEGQEYPLEVRWIKSKRAKNHSFLQESLLTEVEVKLMAESCSNARDSSFDSTHL